MRRQNVTDVQDISDHSTQTTPLAAVPVRVLSPRCARRCNLWGYRGPLPVITALIRRPPGMNNNCPEASGSYWHP